MTSFYTEEELKILGFKSYGTNVLISRKASIYGADKIVIGNNVRIDDFCVLSISKSLVIGDYVHIACFVSIIGAGEIKISDFCGLSGRVSIYSSTDDYSGNAMTNPMVPESLTCVRIAPVILEKHVIVGCGSAIMPGVTLGEGVAIGALSLVLTDCKPNYIYSGNPLKRIIPRSLKYKELEKNLIK